MEKNHSNHAIYKRPLIDHTKYKKILQNPTGNKNTSDNTNVVNTNANTNSANFSANTNDAYVNDDDPSSDYKTALEEMRELAKDQFMMILWPLSISVKCFDSFLLFKIVGKT